VTGPHVISPSKPANTASRSDCSAIAPSIRSRPPRHTALTSGGIAVHIGARVAGLAGAGQVLASRIVTDLVDGSGIDFEDEGEHQLKGVSGIWHVLAVRA